MTLDEAHSSQTGETAAKLKDVLSQEEFAELEDRGEVKDLNSFARLDLGSTQITDAGLTSLQRLHLENTQVTDAGRANVTETS